MDEKQKFLQLMSLMESSGGKNVNHKTVEGGIQAGDTAMGQYGLMPNTIKEMAQRRNIQNTGDHFDKQIQNVDNEIVPSVLVAHPELESRYAEELAAKALEKSGGNQVDAAYRWRWGHNLPNDRVEEIKAQNPDYFERMKKLMPQGVK